MSRVAGMPSVTARADTNASSSALRGAVGLQRLHRVGQRLGDDARQEPLEVQRLAHDVAASRAVAGPGGRRVGRDSHVKDCV